MSQETSTRNVYFSNEDFTVEFEIYKGDLLLHCNVRKFTPSVLRLGYSVFANILLECEQASIPRAFTVTPNPHFTRMFGGTTVNKFSLNEIEYEVIEWVLKPQPWQQSVLVQRL